MRWNSGRRGSEECRDVGGGRVGISDSDGLLVKREVFGLTWKH